LLSIAYSTILVARYTRTVTLKITGFPIIIAYRVRAVSFKITSFTIAVIKLRSFLKRAIGVYIAGRLIEIVF
jgi:hypothetical protein